jgi:hypothetical protein
MFDRYSSLNIDLMLIAPLAADDINGCGALGSNSLPTAAANGFAMFARLDCLEHPFV